MGSKHTLFMKFGQFMSYYKRKYLIKKFNKNCDLKTSSRHFCIKRNLYWNVKLLKKATYIRYVLAKLSKFVQISTQTSSDSFLRWYFENQKGPPTKILHKTCWDKSWKSSKFKKWLNFSNSKFSPLTRYINVESGKVLLSKV